MSLETVSSLEVIRLVIGAVGVLWTWTRWRRMQDLRPPLVAIAVTEAETPHLRAERVQRQRGLHVIELVQLLLFFVHGGFATNALVNLFYTSSSIEQLNVLTSNLLQVIAPLLLIAISVMLDGLVGEATRTAHVLGPKQEAVRWSHLHGRMVPVGDEVESEDPPSA